MQRQFIKDWFQDRRWPIRASPPELFNYEYARFYPKPTREPP
jgi:hypothetical protein